MKLRDAWKTFEGIRSPYLSKAAMNGHYYARRSLLAHLGEDVEIADVTEYAMASWVASQIAAGKKPRGINTRIVTVRALGHFLAKMKLAPYDNALATVDRVKVPASAIEYLTAEQLRAVLEAEPDRLFRRIMFFGAYTGLRVSDLLAVRFEDVVDGQLCVTMKKTGARVGLPLHPEVQKIVELQRAETSGTGLLWGVRIQTHQLYMRMRAAGLRAGIHWRVHPHTLRKTFASRLVRQGCTLDRVARLLGHSDMTCVKVYASLQMDDVLPEVLKLPALATGSAALW